MLKIQYTTTILNRRFITATVTYNDRVYEASFDLNGEFSIKSMDRRKIDVDIDLVYDEMMRRASMELSG